MKGVRVRQGADSTDDDQPTLPREPRRRSTSHLKDVPESKELREAIRTECLARVDGLDRSEPVAKESLELLAREILARLNFPEGYVGWTMVALTSAFWRDQVAAVPPNRRLLLLPHCLKHAEGCPADYDQFGLDCKKCGACSIADFRTSAEALGYKVLVAEGSPIVLKIIVGGHVDAIVGVACLNVLEKSIDKLILAGVPCMAVPLLSSDCRNTSVDEDWVHEMIQAQRPAPEVCTRSYLHLMRFSEQMFERDELERLAPRTRTGSRLSELDGDSKQNTSIDPIAATEVIAYDFLSKGGKYSRPFVTLATYDALTGSKATLSDGAEHLTRMAAASRRIALAIEVFHKASLVHDDVQDGDLYRYGVPTLHRRYGDPMAINVGDYLLGLGYRLISSEASSLGAEETVDILNILSRAHMRLSEGQGAELFWRDSRDRAISPLDALKIYSLKTAPAFEAALHCGARLAGPTEKYAEPIRKFSQHLGIAFQILNDLKDWQDDQDNKITAGGDVLGGRPTVLWALALESLGSRDRESLLRLSGDRSETPTSVEKIILLYHQAEVFDKAHRLVDKYQARAESEADEFEPDEFRRLLYYLIDTVLERSSEPTPALVTSILPASIPVVNEA